MYVLLVRVVLRALLKHLTTMYARVVDTNMYARVVDTFDNYGDVWYHFGN